MTDDTSDLAARFRALRDADRAAAPPFIRIRAAALHRARPRRRLRLAWAGGAAVFVGIVLLLLRAAPPAAPSLTDWRSPTAFLLQTPGGELLDTLPALGDWPQPSPASLLFATPSPLP